MKKTITLVPLVLVGVATPSFGQNFNSGAFFQPKFRVEKPQGAMGLGVNADLYENQASSGNVIWAMRAGGYSGLGVTAVARVHHNAFTETTGSSLVFGRRLDIVGVPVPLQLGETLGTVLGANLLACWSAPPGVVGLNIQANQLHKVSFDISADASI